MRLGTIAFLLGIVLVQRLCTLPDLLWCWLLVPLGPLLLYLPRVRCAGLLLAGVLWATLNAHWILDTVLDPGVEGKDVVVVGVVSSLPEVMARRTRFLMDVDTLSRLGRPIPFRARVRLNWYGRPPRLSAGDVWRLKVRLKRPRGYMNPGGFDYEGWLFQHRIRATGYVRDDSSNRRLDVRHRPIARLRDRLARAVAGALHGSPYTGIVSALTVGDRHGISAEQWQVFNATGTTHLMAISGLHIGLVAGIVFFIVERLWAWTVVPLWPWPSPKVAAVAAMTGALCYAALAGFSVPTVRAVVMLSVVMAALLRQSHHAPSQILAAALFLVLLVDPLAVMGVGVWLSFFAVAVILYGMTGRVSGRGLWWKWGRMQWLVALGLAPLLLLFFRHSSLSAPVANLVAVPWVSFAVVPPALVGLCLHGLAPGAGDVCLRAADAAFGLLWPLLHWLSRHDPGITLCHAPAWWTALTAGAGTLLLLAPRGLPGRYLGVMLVAPLFLVQPPAPPPGRVWFTLLDVGQGLSAVVRTHSHTLVYDTGPRLSDRFDTGAAVVVPFLHAKGVAFLDTLVVSHGDNDHIGGARSILRTMDVGRVLTSVPDRFSVPRVRHCSDRQAWSWDGVDFRILNPPPVSPLTGNNASCVLRVEDAAGHAVLLTGDIEGPTERFLVKNRAFAVAADIVTVPHHGSDTSSSDVFVNAVNPRYALFPVGYRNRYGFPKPDVVARYREEGAELYGTDRSGAITFHIGAEPVIPPPRLYRRDARRYWNSP
jgi:competence protein ComEC